MLLPRLLSKITRVLCLDASIDESDIRNEDSKKFQIEFQNICMNHLVGIDFEASSARDAYYKLNRFALIHQDQDPQLVCQWMGVVCTNHLVTEITWGHTFTFSVSAIQWIPTTVKAIELVNKRVCRQFITRALPRDARQVRMPKCDLLGNVNLRSLPENLEELHLRSNALKGSLFLDELPVTLRLIDLSINEIKVVFFRNHKLPSSLENILVYNPRKKIVFESLDEDRVMDSRIHEGLYLEEY